MYPLLENLLKICVFSKVVLLLFLTKKILMMPIKGKKKTYGISGEIFILRIFSTKQSGMNSVNTKKERSRIETIY